MEMLTKTKKLKTLSTFQLYCLTSISKHLQFKKKHNYATALIFHFSKFSLTLLQTRSQSFPDGDFIVLFGKRGLEQARGVEAKRMMGKKNGALVFLKFFQKELP